jgi:hypothetical protein
MQVGQAKLRTCGCHFKRYSEVFDAVYETHDGTDIDPNTWTLEQHFDYFKHLVI